MIDFEKCYKKDIVSTYSDISFASLSNSVDLTERSFSLQDIFFSTRLSKPENYKDYRFVTKGEYFEEIDKSEIREENKRLSDEISSLLDTVIDDSMLYLEGDGFNKESEEDEDLNDCLKSNPLESLFARIGESIYELNRLDDAYRNLAERRMILGKPGSGKSTYIRRIALAYALEEKEFMRSNHWNENMFPLFVQFKSFSGVINEKPNIMNYAENNFVEFLYQATCYEIKGFKEKVGLSEFENIVTDKIKKNNLYIIVDSYDEISEEIRYTFTKSLREFLWNNAGVNLLLCSRIESIDLSNERKGRVTKELCQIPGLKYQSIQDLNNTEIAYFTSKWFDVVFGGKEQNKIKVERIVKTLLSYKLSYLDQIKRVPLYLSNILCIARNTGEIPKSKNALLEKFVELCLNSFANEDSEYDNIKKQLAYLAYTMTVDEKKIIRKSELKEYLLECYGELGWGFNPEIPQDDIDGYISKVLCLCNMSDIFRVHITMEGEDAYQFTHLQFQEYFTAYAVNKLYCRNVTRRALPIEFIEPYFKDRRWKEICLMAISMEDQRWGADEYVEKLMVLVNKEEDDYYCRNMLYDIILNNMDLSRDLRYKVYETLFGKSITAQQIKDVCDGIDNELLPDELLSYIKEKFESSTNSDELAFPFIYAVVQAEKCINKGKNPLRYAENLLLERNDSKRILGWIMIDTIAWCQYNNINARFVECGCIIADKVISALIDCLESDNRLLVIAASFAMENIVLAEHLDDTADYWHAVISRCRLELSNTEKQIYIRKIISVIPISFNAIVEMQDVLQHEMGDKIVEAFDRGYDKDDARTYLASFVECALSHRWLYSNESLMKWMRNIQVKILSQKGIADEIKIRSRQINRQISVLPNPVSAGISEYKAHHYDSAKKYFIFALSEGLDVKTYLGYMLRRKEIESVIVSGHSYSVEELLENGIHNLDPASLINKALLLCHRDGQYDYEVGIEYLSQYLTKSKLEKTYSWWYDQAKRGDPEGIVVLLWLLDLNLIDENRIDLDRDYLLKNAVGFVTNIGRKLHNR